MRRTSAVLLLLLPAPLLADPPGQAPPVVAEITREVTRPGNDPAGRPLPVVSHWANGFGRPNFASDYQIGLLEKGHHVVPTLPFPRPGEKAYPEAGKPWVEKLARWKAPFALRAGQWEQVLLEKDMPPDDPGRWRRLPPEKSPLTVDLTGKVSLWISPWGAVKPWYEAGLVNTRSGAFAQLQEWYPDPPRVILLSNNEARKLKPKQDIAAMSKRFVDAHGKGAGNDVVRKAMAEGYLERYAALLEGVRDGLTSPAWKKNAILVGYGCFGPPHFGRMTDWDVYSHATDERISPWHLVWDGGSPSYYTHSWNPSTDYRVWSPQVEANNWVFMLEEAQRERPTFWFELSIWDGNNADPKKGKNQRKLAHYLEAGQEWSPRRYAGFVQYGMWLLRPRVVREFRGSTVPRAEFGKDFEALVAGVDRVWRDPVLTRFWRQSELVPNRARKHPYQTRIPKKYAEVDRWFLLSTSLDAPGEWKLDTEIPVFSLARVRGPEGEREWLLYAHAPLGARQGVRIDVPGFGQVTVDVTPGGSFYHLQEKGRGVKALVEG